MATYPPPSGSPTPNALNIAAALVAWLGAQVVMVGMFDQWMVDTATGDTFVVLGTTICLLGSFALGVQKLRAPIGARRLWILCLGLMPITMFLLFLTWRISISGEQRSACEANDAVACRELAERRAKRGKTEDAIGLFERACALNDARGCRELGGQARLMPALAQMEPVAYFQKACALGDGLGCDRAAQALRATSPEESQKFFQRGCDLGYASSCGALHAE